MNSLPSTKAVSKIRRATIKDDAQNGGCKYVMAILTAKAIGIVYKR